MNKPRKLSVNLEYKNIVIKPVLKGFNNLFEVKVLLRGNFLSKARYEEFLLRDFICLYKEYEDIVRVLIKEGIMDVNSKCVFIHDIYSFYKDIGCGELILNYLKNNYGVIFLYSTREARDYWISNDFKEVSKGFMYYVV